MRRTSRPHATTESSVTGGGPIPRPQGAHALAPAAQDSAVGSREAYYAYHLGREVQQHHQRLWVGLCVVPPVLGSGSLQEPTGLHKRGHGPHERRKPAMRETAASSTSNIEAQFCHGASYTQQS